MGRGQGLKKSKEGHFLKEVKETLQAVAQSIENNVFLNKYTDSNIINKSIVILNYSYIHNWCDCRFTYSRNFVGFLFPTIEQKSCKDDIRVILLLLCY